MHADEALAHERKGADEDLHPMFGDWQHQFNFAQLSYAAGEAKRAAFREALQAELKNIRDRSDASGRTHTIAPDSASQPLGTLEATPARRPKRLTSRRATAPQTMPAVSSLRL